MGLFWDIFLRFAQILTVIAGISGIALSLLLLFSPDLVRILSNFFNYQLNLEKKLSALNKYIQTGPIIYRHNILFGGCLIAGSIFVLIFLFFKLDVTKFSNIFNEIIVDSIILLGKISMITGIILGFFLLFSPKTTEKIEGKMNLWLDTQQVVNKLDEFHDDIDTIFFRHPKSFGFAGLIISTILFVLSIVNLYR
jgi:hypothetical protein